MAVNIDKQAPWSIGMIHNIPPAICNFNNKHLPPPLQMKFLKIFHILNSILNLREDFMRTLHDFTCIFLSVTVQDVEPTV